MLEQPKERRIFDFMGAFKYTWGVSVAIILLGLVLLFVPGFGLKKGIDFTGGAIMDLHFDKAVTTGEVRNALVPTGYGDSVIQLAGQDEKSVLIRTKPMSDAQRRDVNAAIQKSLGSFQTNRIESVDPVIGKDLVRSAIIAVVLASIGMLLYITIRFEIRFAVAGIIALLHDVFLTIAVFVIFRLEIDSAFIAAILTILGYSINDTIVIYDRIRENLRLSRKEDPRHLVNRSITETMMRSINTMATVIIAVLALFVLGGPTIRNFNLALLVGIVSGGYSSIFIASPIWLMWRNHESRQAGAKKEEAAKTAREARLARQARSAGLATAGAGASNVQSAAALAGSGEESDNGGMGRAGRGGAAGGGTGAARAAGGGKKSAKKSGAKGGKGGKKRR